MIVRDRCRLFILAAACCLSVGCVGISVEVERRSPSTPIVAEAPSIPISEIGFAADRAATILPAVQISIPAIEPVTAPLALAELLRLANENNPRIKQANTEVAAARGAAVQAGLHPNPTVGYQGDQILSGWTAGQQGAFLAQKIVTKGKLALAQAAALAEVTRAEAALQETRADLAATVRSRYFLLVNAKESVRIAEQMAGTAEKLADRQKKLLDSGQPVAPHEVAQAKALAGTAQGEVTQARNRRIAAEKLLAAVAGIADMPRFAIAPADRLLPDYSFDELKRRVLERHTDLQAAAAQVERARFTVELARVTPYPNIETSTYVQQDFQARTPQFGVQIGMAIPVFDRNQGNIAQAEALLVKASLEADRVRLELSNRLTEAYERYTSNRGLLNQYRTTILPEQLKAFDGVSKRFEQEPGKVSFTEVVLTQQTLANTYTAYLNVLGAAWQAVAEITRLTQNDEAYPAKSDDPNSGENTWPEQKD